MTGQRLIHFVRQNAIALVALFIALGGTGYAAVRINGASIKNGSITGKKLKKHTLTGTQINVSKLGIVVAAQNASKATFATTAGSATTATSATSATNATSLGGVAAAGYLQSGCGAQAIDGYAVIDGSAASFPTTYTSSAPFIANSFNCSGQTAEVRRVGTGVYDIEFPGSGGTIGTATVDACVLGGSLLCLATDPRTVSMTLIRSGADAGSFQALVRDSESGSDVDDDVNVLILGHSAG